MRCARAPRSSTAAEECPTSRITIPQATGPVGSLTVAVGGAAPRDGDRGLLGSRLEYRQNLLLHATRKRPDALAQVLVRIRRLGRTPLGTEIRTSADARGRAGPAAREASLFNQNGHAAEGPLALEGQLAQRISLVVVVPSKSSVEKAIIVESTATRARSNVSFSSKTLLLL